ncbi:methyltransferase domain-containing protein [Modestobacter sp. I12A-02628]|uniref:Class I SAM-dependent methyltransferase n=1 Tax=Goekera deserti TaxID=2497753 RepID=A0A7K3WC98_9ACTN|nr:class I SAM-dependent methyltransferase [Goekera deserti]MPQ98401.1 methyltransferase domain-containing protein [Goekera deserti]NDI48228.1 methyltransferase domain-containing protein [Goekera deserti]NEL53977.1 class I SAM-dependent methyltransferase [Goekera deserti]
MDLQPVRDAYSTMSEQYIGLLDSGWPDDQDDTALVRRHLTGLAGPVFDLGCGPGHWTAYLDSLGAEVTGVDPVPEFIAHARATYTGSRFRLGSMMELDVPEHSVAGILSWYSTIHVPPPELGDVLAEFHRILAPSGVLVAGFFDSDDAVAAFEHKVITAYRWPADVFAQHLVAAGFDEIQRLQHQIPERPHRKYAAIAVRAC